MKGQPRDRDGTWWLHGYSAASELTDDDLSTLDGIAERCGVTFDDWGTHLGSPNLDDGPGQSRATEMAVGAGPADRAIRSRGRGLAIGAT
jgi:hypothetical protein